ncbi:MAG: class I SAM-dependent methyltransferase [Thermoanaerobaculia bacterium]|nr:class I SAM-dependent methyltransferase [Thermoanaerobaculia bacterium]
MAAWYKEWFGEEYLDLYAHRDTGEAERHVEFVRKQWSTPPRAVLDLACGAGRHTAALRHEGIRTLGSDLSLTLLAQNPALPRVAADMRRLPFANGSFDWVLNFFTSFGYFDHERENFKVLEEIVRVLEPGGGLLMDLMNVDVTLDNLREFETQERNGQKIEIRRSWDPDTRRITKQIRLCTPGREARTFFESVRAYTHDEVIIGLRWAGLEVRDVFGNFDGEPYGRDSERLILVGHKTD